MIVGEYSSRDPGCNGVSEGREVWGQKDGVDGYEREKEIFGHDESIYASVFIELVVSFEMVVGLNYRAISTMSRVGLFFLSFSTIFLYFSAFSYIF